MTMHGQDALTSGLLIGRDSPVWEGGSDLLKLVGPVVTVLGNGADAVSRISRGEDVPRTAVETAGKSAAQIIPPLLLDAGADALLGAAIGTEVPIPFLGTAIGAGLGLGYGLLDHHYHWSDKAGKATWGLLNGHAE